MIYNRMAEYLASMNPQMLLEFKATPDEQARFEALRQKESIGGISQVEKDELDHFIMLDRVIGLAKSYAILQQA